MTLIAVSEALQKSVDGVIDDFLNNRPDSGEFKAIQEYFEIDGWDDIFSASNDLIALNFELFSQRYLGDPELRSHVGLEDDEPIADSDRLAFAREMMSYLAEDLDDCVTPSIVYCTIQDRKGRDVVIGGYTEIHGQAGPETTWLPIVRSEPEFFRQLRDYKLILTGEIDTITDSQILTAWRD